MRNIRTKNNVDLSVEIAGIKMKNPVLAASGAFGYGTEYLPLVSPALFGAVITKTVTLLPRAGNVPPRIYETPMGMLNSIGLANVGVHRFLEEKLPELLSHHPLVIVNIAGNTMEEYAELAGMLNGQPGISAIELNISCPNVKQGGMAFGADPIQAVKLTTLVKKATSKPLIVKLSPNVSDIAAIARAVEQAGADALSLINTLYGMAIDIERQKPVLGNVTGGLSGPAIKPVALYNVFKTSRAVNIPVIGLGGIMTAGDAVEFMLAGAAAVQIGTAGFINPNTVKEIVNGLKDYCLKKKYPEVSQITGKLAV
ncbi:dihydroorotate dehydrogenase [candidate division TA06 bacterium]|uniref:Dihydroorotate dehydrogenase n=1 Tax=candidate division TA06 bacterium TaxID=2250710 RepID=A0A933MKE3_UNCT6|nr:dihydroorotate dehydrogenase [candidate division TA06 bacterium]